MAAKYREELERLHECMHQVREEQRKHHDQLIEIRNDLKWFKKVGGLIAGGISAAVGTLINFWRGM